MKRPELVRGRRGVIVVVDERQAAPLSHTLNHIGVPSKPDFWDRFDAVCDRFLKFATKQALWIAIGLSIALALVAGLAQVFGWAR